MVTQACLIYSRWKHAAPFCHHPSLFTAALNAPGGGEKLLLAGFTLFVRVMVSRDNSEIQTSYFTVLKTNLHKSSSSMTLKRCSAET